MTSYIDELAATDPKTYILESPESVVSFWYGSINHADIQSLEYLDAMMGVWFAGKSPHFDQIQRENTTLVERVAAAEEGGGQLGEEWSSPTGYLAKILLLDQFPRCIFRGSPLAFQHDPLVARLVQRVVQRRWFSAPGVFVPIQRLFLGVALQHSEDIDAQRLGVLLAGQVAGGAEGNEQQEDVARWVQSLRGYPMEHHDIMARFGRFPGRNDALGRVSTAEEVAWLQSPECPSWAKSQQVPKEGRTIFQLNWMTQ